MKYCRIFWQCYSAVVTIAAYSGVITTSHSSRRRTQMVDFEAIQVWCPAGIEEQRRLIKPLTDARRQRLLVEQHYQQLKTDIDDILDPREDDYNEELFED
jgi:hypothetical protein